MVATTNNIKFQCSLALATLQVLTSHIKHASFTAETSIGQHWGPDRTTDQKSSVTKGATMDRIQVEREVRDGQFYRWGGGH